MKQIENDERPRVLVVDDERVCQEKIKVLCSKFQISRSVDILCCSNLEQARKIIAENSPIQVILLDKNLGWGKNDDNGIEAIPEFLQIQPQLQVLVITSSKEISDCEKAMRYGAFGYVLKDYPDSVIAAQIKKAIEVAEIKLDNIKLDRGNTNITETDIIGKSKVIQSIRRSLKAFASSSAPVLLTGETGTGKTTAAQLIHRFRQEHLLKKNQPFFKLNLGSIPDELATRELFGNEKGAYTDAKQARLGYLELANGGTLFLDEVGEASLGLQTKLLTAIEDGKFYRLGSEIERKSEFKLICATNKDLENMIQNKKFREDFFMRINTLTLRLPSLKERQEDIPLIIKSLLPKISEANNVRLSFTDLPEDLIEYLTENPPRGNIRGLIQQLSRIVVYSYQDKNSCLILKDWKKVPGVVTKRSRVLTMKETLTAKEILERPLDIMDNSFEGLSPLVEKLKVRVITEAKNNFKKNKEAAKYLGISESSFCVQAKNIHASNATNSQGGIQ